MGFLISDIRRRPWHFVTLVIVLNVAVVTFALVMTAVVLSTGVLAEPVVVGRRLSDYQQSILYEVKSTNPGTFWIDNGRGVFLVTVDDKGMITTCQFIDAD